MKTAIESNVVFLRPPRTNIVESVIDIIGRAIFGLLMFVTVLAFSAFIASPFIAALIYISKNISITLR